MYEQEVISGLDRGDGSEMVRVVMGKHILKVETTRSVQLNLLMD